MLLLLSRASFSGWVLKRLSWSCLERVDFLVDALQNNQALAVINALSQSVSVRIMRSFEKEESV